MRIYQICRNCGCDAFNVYKEEGELGTYEECIECNSNDIGFKDETLNLNNTKVEE